MEKYSLNEKRVWPLQMVFQWICFLAINLGMVSSNPVSFGLNLLLYYPNHKLVKYTDTDAYKPLRGTGLQCYERDKELEEATLPSWLTESNKVNRLLRWAPCTQAHICETDGLRWRVDPNDPEHMMNFVQRFDLLCNPNATKVMTTALISGLIVGMIFVPSYSDLYGRKNPFLLSLTLSIVA